MLNVTTQQRNPGEAFSEYTEANECANTCELILINMDSTSLLCMEIRSRVSFVADQSTGDHVSGTRAPSIMMKLQ